MAEKELYLMRHAGAEDGDVNDSSRALTKDGIKDLNKVLTSMGELADVEPDEVLTSDFRRAEDTGKIVAKYFSMGKGAMDCAKDLRPDADPHEAWLCIADTLQVEDCVVVVTHQPLLGQLVNFVLGTSGLRIKFKHGSVIRIDFEDEPSTSTPSGILRWFLTPKVSGGEA